MSPVEIVEAHLRRIEEVNPRLNAVVTLAPNALDLARRAEEELTRGRAAGALHGVPVTVKDTIEAAGLRSTSGTKLRADYVPDTDAPAVARLRAAGAIILGKTNTSELALEYNAENPVFGRTNNPHDHARTPGGSSGGCAAAVAACMVPASLGSDLSGSVRVPAHFCGVVSLRPTSDGVPAAGHFMPTDGALALGASLGPLARRVEDLELLYGALRGSSSREQEEGGEETPRGIDLRGRRAAWYSDDGLTPVTIEVARAVEDAARALAAAGMVVRRETPPAVGRGNSLWLELFSPQVHDFLSTRFAGRGEDAGAAARSMLRGGVGEDASAFERASRALATRERLRAELLAWMEETPLLVAPVGAVPALPHGARKVEVGGETLSVFRAFSYAQAFNVFDLPAACVPAGRTSEGLPVGVQVVGRPGAEGEVLAAARVVEVALGGWQPPPEM